MTSSGGCSGGCSGGSAGFSDSATGRGTSPSSCFELSSAGGAASSIAAATSEGGADSSTVGSSMVSPVVAQPETMSESRSKSSAGVFIMRIFLGTLRYGKHWIDLFIREDDSSRHLPPDGHTLSNNKKPVARIAHGIADQETSK